MAWITRALEPFGISPIQVFTAAGLGDSPASLDGSGISLQNYHRLLEVAAELTGDMAIAVHMAENIEVSDFHILGYLVENSPNIGEWLRNYSRYHAIFSRDHSLNISEGQSCISFEYTPFAFGCSISSHDVILSIAGLVVALRRHLGSDWAPSACTVSIERPAGHDEFERVLGVQPTYAGSVNAITISAHDLDVPVKAADAALLMILREQADRLLEQVHEEEEILYLLRMHIAGNIDAPSFCLREAAHRLNLSPRSLHRRLASFGKSFRGIREEVLLQLARRDLIHSSLSITEIALRLGYSETSAFTRAFLRLEGVGPSEFRKKARRNHAEG